MHRPALQDSPNPVALADQIVDIQDEFDLEDTRRELYGDAELDDDDLEDDDLDEDEDDLDDEDEDLDDEDDEEYDDEGEPPYVPDDDVE